MATNTGIADTNLLSLFQFTGIDKEDFKLLTNTHRVSTIEQLLEKRDDLKRAKIRGVDRGRQQKLSKCILWYQEFRRVYKKEPIVSKDLTEDVLIDFEADDYRIPVVGGAGLEHIFSILHANSNDLKNRLADCGISTFDDVLRHRKSLEQCAFVSENITPRIQTELAQVADWFDEFSETHGRAPNLIQDLTADVFTEFVKRNHTKYNLPAEALLSLVKLSIHANGPPPFMTSYKEEDRPEIYRQIIAKAVEEIKKTHMPPLLHSMAPKFLDDQLEYWVKGLFNFENKDTFNNPMLIGARTQSGKSPIKAVGLAVCRALKIPCVVITTQVPLAKDLHGKLQDFAPERDRDLVASTSVLRKKKTTEAEVKRIFENGGAFVIADTKPQVAKINEAIDKYWLGKKLVAMIDEADAHFRTGDRSRKYECEYEKFMAKRPCFRFFITATPVPALLALDEEEHVEDIKFWEATPCDEYVGLEHMRLLQDKDGNELFLEQGGLNYKTKRNNPIPYTDVKVMRLYKDAVESENKGVLLLDITDSRVTAEGNVRVKASKVQQHLMKNLGKKVIVVTFTGGGLAYSLPGQSWVECPKGTKVRELLDFLDEMQQDDPEAAPFSLEKEEDDDDDDDEIISDIPASNSEQVREDNLARPIFIFGFAMMKRGISHGSLKRRPTHIVLHMGQGHCIENVVQAVGRGTFIGKKVLLDNGHDHVKVLMTSGDWDMVRAYQSYVSEVAKRVRLYNESVREALTGAVKSLPAYANYLAHTFRRTGQRSKYKPNAFDERHNPVFDEAVELTTGDKALAKLLYASSNPDLVRVALVCCHLWRSRAEDFHRDDVLEAYNDEYRYEELVIKKTDLNKYLREMIKHKLLKQKAGESKKVGSVRYSLENIIQRLELILGEVRKREEAKHSAPDVIKPTGGCKRVKTEQL